MRDPSKFYRTHSTISTSGGIVRALCGRSVWSVDTSEALGEVSCIPCLKRLQGIYQGELKQWERKVRAVAERLEALR